MANVIKNGGGMPVVENKSFESLQESITETHDRISNTDTPKCFVSDKAGMDYVEEGYMRHLLNKSFPIWTWEVLKHEFLGDAWIVVHGKLTIIDSGMKRSYDALASHRIQKKRGTEVYVDIGNDIKAANSDCFKVAVNRLCNIADDVYRKRIDDVSLSDKQEKELTTLLAKLDDKKVVEKVTDGISNMSINSTNLEATKRRINALIKE